LQPPIALGLVWSLWEADHCHGRRPQRLGDRTEIHAQLANELGLEGFIIASSLARGIDTAAHLAALERGTIAVLAGGIDIVYPPENADLQSAIGE